MAGAGQPLPLNYTTAALLSTQKQWEKLCDEVLLVGDEWKPTLLGIFQSPNFTNVFAELGRREATGEVIYPRVYNLFSWTRVPECAPNEVKVVLVGQDPVPDVKATGIAFMFIEPTTSNNSIRNMLNVVEGGSSLPQSWPITWCKQGVLMINNVPTIGCVPTKVVVPAMGGVPAGEKIEMVGKSHWLVGWQNFTQQLVGTLRSNIIYVLFGAKAKSNLEELLLEEQCIFYPHPSPIWRGQAHWNARVAKGKFTDEVNARLANIQVGTITWGISPQYSVESVNQHYKGVIYTQAEAEKVAKENEMSKLLNHLQLTGWSTVGALPAQHRMI